MVRYEVRDQVAIITVDNPPVNALSPGVPEAIEEAVERAAGDPAARAAILVGAGSTFIAGADIRMFASIRTREASIERSRGVHARLRRIEDCPKPLVAAIHGTALGGGLEIAMACHYRIAIPSARVGQPEVLLGIIPGAGGTQRLPRLAGVPTALELCTQGNHIEADRALRDGILDRIVDGELLPEAVAFARELVGIRKTREMEEKIRDRDAGLAACAATRLSLKRIARGARGPYASLEAVEASITRGFDAGSEREIELFANCLVSQESRNMVRLFFAEREVAKVPGIPRDTPVSEIRLAAVVGAGTMGGGIAMSYANAGIPVLLKEQNQEPLDRGIATIRRNYEISVSKGRISRERYEQAMALIRPTLSWDGFDEVDIAVEAVFEDFELKRTIFAELGRVTRPECLLASNTSTLDIDAFADASGRPERVMGHHFFSPANVMRLLEIVRGGKTSNEAIATSLKLARRLHKVGVVVGNGFGFVANRMLAYYMREALLLLEEGAGVPQIDQALIDFGMPVGPFAMQDIAGIDVGWRIRQFLKQQGRTRAEGPQSPIPDWLHEMGRYGQKTACGWYRYDRGTRTGTPDPLIEDLAHKAATARGIERRAISNDEIISRIMTAVANEGANVLDEEMAIRPGDIDVIYVHGFGFPRHRGGPMAWADDVGLREILARVHRYRERFGDYWKPSPLLERLAVSGRGFYTAAAAA